MVVACLGCSSDDDCKEAGLVRLATFNTGLAEGDIEHVVERRAPLIEALAASDLDLLCVQEVWPDWQALVDGIQALPNTVRKPPLEVCPASCNDSELATLMVCGELHCADLTGPELVECGTSLCSEELVGLLPVCAGCVLTHAAGGLDAIAIGCASDGDEAAESFIYDCSYATGILTSAEILEQDSRQLDSFAILSAVGYARIDTQAGAIDVFCTHLGSELRFEYAGAYGDYKSEQAAQIEQLLAFIDDKSDHSRPVVLMGDLNNGPDIAAADITGAWPEHYERLLEAGFKNPYASRDDVSCTLCPDNTLRTDDSNGVLLDHILVRDAPGVTRCNRTMMETTSIELDGVSTPSSYSDHYGLVLDMWCGR